MSRHRLALVFCVAYLALQIAVPVVQLMRDDRPLPFGWQMYAGVPDRYHYELVVGDSLRRVPAEHRRYIARYRAEIDFRDPIARALCADHPEALAVAARRQSGRPGEWILPCF